jgi:phage shock protein PspC (stress-responsive transcriptional regulator)
MSRRSCWQQAEAMNATTANPAADSQPESDREPQSDIQSDTQPDPRSEPQPEARSDARALHRPVQDRMLGGVAAGLAHYLGVDVTIVRIAIAVLTVAGGAGLPLYLAGWLLIPEEGAAQSLAGEFIQNWQARSNSL